MARTPKTDVTDLVDEDRDKGLRDWAMHDLMSRCKWDYEKIARAFGVSVRTVFRSVADFRKVKDSAV